MPRPFDADTVLALPLMANLATIAEDGAPRNAPVWFAWEDGVLWMLGAKDGASVRRIARDPRVSVEVVDYDNPQGLLRHVGLRGTASIAPCDGDRFRRLLTRYLGPEPQWNGWFINEIARIDDPDGRMIRLQPDTLFTNDVSYYRTGPALAARTAPTVPVRPN